MVRVGDIIEIRARKADGSVYRWWRAAVESVDDTRVVTVNRVGDPVLGPCGGWAFKHTTRTVYWFSRQYNLAEVYQPDGRLKQIYIHIASTAHLDGDILSYTDHELDVVRRPGQPLRVVDEDEFHEACTQFGYSPEFQGRCRKAVNEALRVAATWKVSGPPRGNRCRPTPPTGAAAGQPVRTSTPATDSSTRKTEV